MIINGRYVAVGLVRSVVWLIDRRWWWEKQV